MKSEAQSQTGLIFDTASVEGEQQLVSDSEMVQLCTFEVGSDAYVLDIMRIREIINPLKITPVRRSSPLVEGVIDLRGEVIPIVDLRRLLGVEMTPFTRSTKQIIASVGKRLVGFVVDSMGRVIVVPKADIQPLPALDEREGRVFPGVVNHRGDLLLLLNIKALLDEEGLSSEQLTSLRRRALGSGGGVGR